MSPFTKVYLSYNRLNGHLTKIHQSYTRLNGLLAKIYLYYTRFNGPLMKMDLSYTRLNGPFAKMYLFYTRFKGSFTKIDISYTRLDGPFTKIDLSYIRLWFFFLTCHRPTSASGKLDRPLIKLDRPLIFQGASGHFDENRAILTKVRPFLMKSLQNVTKMYQNGNFPKKIYVKFANLRQNR